MLPMMNATQPWQIFQYVNEVTEYYFGPVILLIIWISIYVTMDTSKPAKNAVVASWVTFFITGIFWWLSIINMVFVIISVVMLIFSVIAVYVSRETID